MRIVDPPTQAHLMRTMETQHQWIRETVGSPGLSRGFTNLNATGEEGRSYIGPFATNYGMTDPNPSGRFAADE